MFYIIHRASILSALLIALVAAVKLHHNLFC